MSPIRAMLRPSSGTPSRSPMSCRESVDNVSQSMERAQHQSIRVDAASDLSASDTWIEAPRTRSFRAATSYLGRCAGI